MPDKEQNQPHDNHSTAKSADVSPDDIDEESFRRHRRLVVTLWVVGAVVAVLVFIAGLFVVRAIFEYRTSSRYPGFVQTETSHIRVTSPFGYSRFMQTSSDNNTVNTTVYTSLTGVVTAVNGDNIIVAGDGKQTTITTNSSTTYDGDVKPKVNDTVTVIGTTAGDTTTATEIGVLNR